MARRNKDDNVAILILIIIGAMAWGIYVAVKALINLNERFIESVSNPAGVIGLFFGLLIAVALIIRVFIYRGFRKKATDLAKKEQAFDETVSSEVACKLYQEKQQLAVQWTEFHNARNKASRALQRIVDSAYKFKVKTLLSGTTVNNWQSKYDQLRKERDAYAAISEKITFLELEDNADWEAVKQQFLDKVALLEKAQEEKEYQAELKRQIREEKQRQDELEQQQREAEEEEQRLAEQQRLLEEALLAAEGTHREELERQRLELEQKIQDVHQQYERAKSMAQLTRQGYVYIISNIGSFGENVFKIGMTRRLEPMERVKELSGAAVPFDFDVHAMISCDDAPALEKRCMITWKIIALIKLICARSFFGLSFVGLLMRSSAIMVRLNILPTRSRCNICRVWNMQKAKLHKMVGRVATTGVEAPLTEPVLVMKSFPLATWRGSKIKVMEKLHDRPDKVAKKAIQKGDWRFILSAMAAERRLLRLRMVSPAGIEPATSP